MMNEGENCRFVQKNNTFNHEKITTKNDARGEMIISAGCITRKQSQCFLLLLLGFLVNVSDAFLLRHNNPSPSLASSSLSKQRQRQDISFSKLNAVDFTFFYNSLWQAPPSTLESGVLSNYAPAAASLFNNMKLPAAVVTAGMISLGFATSFPELPKDANFSDEVRKRCESLRRLHIVVALISVTSELIVVLWAAVEVNQLTERPLQPAASVWDLIQRDCDLAWSAVNSHFVLGIIGFCAMLAIRAYVMLLAARASKNLTSAAMTGTAAALCLMISVVNRGVEAGGGDGVGYGGTILDLLQHYVYLLLTCATDLKSPGPLELTAIGLEVASIGFALQVLLSGDDKLKDDENEMELIPIPPLGTKEAQLLHTLKEEVSSASAIASKTTLLEDKDQLHKDIGDVILQKDSTAQQKNAMNSIMSVNHGSKDSGVKVGDSSDLPGKKISSTTEMDAVNKNKF
uniref:Transmembrane protein n=1 Tax=Ditylum brightwellii TaxID=49249 RepID=A0A7S2ECV2_9STRA|mmetsp:Transcript_24018/g.35815  ORF Transcript_24018/g.35815 Transcript_24018/m.35815 type:complete len:458 (+) Transcript_24018:50-1423(+)